jgi:hypothetical protein
MAVRLLLRLNRPRRGHVSPTPPPPTPPRPPALAALATGPALALGGLRSVAIASSSGGREEEINDLRLAACGAWRMAHGAWRMMDEG